MRDFLQDRKIVGAVCASRNTEMLNIVIPNLLKYSDWLLVLLDNETNEVRALIEDYQRKFYDKVWVRRSSIPHNVITRNGHVADYHRRWKGVKGIVRDEVFVNLRRILGLNQPGYDKIDILLFPDQDEIFTDYLPELLVKFWDSNCKAVALKMIHVIDDMRTIKEDIMRHHCHVFKYSDDLCGLPWQFQNQMHPISWSETMRAEYYSVHLAYYGEEQRKWRKSKWKDHNLNGSSIWKLDRDIVTYSPDEIVNTFKLQPSGKFYEELS